ncbi:Nif3-like dinuclear metal center hexameric protein [Candidatus Latescibacterota bacterium]
MIKICDVVETLERLAPSLLAEKWDNVGLITGSPADEVNSVIITLDVTEETIAFALKKGASLIVSHHPPIFEPLKNLSGNSLSSRVIRRAVSKNIAILASHTNLDQAPDGVSHALAEKLNLTDIRTLTQGNCELFKFVTFCPPEYTDRIRDASGHAGAGVIGNYSLCSFTSRGTGTYIPSEGSAPFEGKHRELSRAEEDRIEIIVPAVFVQNVITEVKSVHPYEEMVYDIIPVSAKEPSFGYGATGNLAQAMKLTNFIERVCSSLEIDSVKCSTGLHKKIKRVAVMGGSGGDYISAAINEGADAYVTGEIDHHEYIENHDAIVLVDATHRATELPVLEIIKAQLESSPELKGIKTIVDRGTSPFKTLRMKK